MNQILLGLWMRDSRLTFTMGGLLGLSMPGRHHHRMPSTVIDGKYTRGAALSLSTAHNTSSLAATSPPASVSSTSATPSHTTTPTPSRARQSSPTRRPRESAIRGGSRLRTTTCATTRMAGRASGMRSLERTTGAQTPRCTWAAVALTVSTRWPRHQTCHPRSTAGSRARSSR